MKKLILLLILSLALAGCSAKNDPIPEQPAVSEAPTAEPTATPTATPIAAPTPTVPPTETPAPTATPAPITAPTQEELVSAAIKKQYEEGSAEREALYAKLSAEKEFPVINITTLGEAKILSKDEYVTSIIDVFNCDESFVLSAEAGVKVRGNSTANQGSEKPYRIKFTKKQGMLGLNDGGAYKSWVLLRSYWNLAPDYMAFQLAEEIFGGNYYCSDCTYVNLYLNGKYAGVYLLAEQNQANKGRIEVYEPSEGETQTEIGYLLELDNYADEEHPFFSVTHGDTEFTDINGVTRRFDKENYSVKSDIFSEEQLEFIEKYTAGVYEILWQAVEHNTAMMFDADYNVVSAEGVYQTVEEAVGAVIDLESLVNMLILEELVQNYDVGAGSFYMCVDFSPESKYEKLTFMAPWDFNWAYTENPNSNYYAGAFQKVMSDGYDRSNPWFTTAMKADWFQQLVKDKWATLSENDSLRNVTQQVADHISLLENDLGADSWRVSCGMDIVNYVNSRIAWLDKQWKK